MFRLQFSKTQSSVQAVVVLITSRKVLHRLFGASLNWPGVYLFIFCFIGGLPPRTSLSSNPIQSNPVGWGGGQRGARRFRGPPKRGQGDLPLAGSGGARDFFGAFPSCKVGSFHRIFTKYRAIQDTIQH